MHGNLSDTFHCLFSSVQYNTDEVLNIVNNKYSSNYIVKKANLAFSKKITEFKRHTTQFSYWTQNEFF